MDRTRLRCPLLLATFVALAVPGLPARASTTDGQAELRDLRGPLLEDRLPPFALTGGLVLLAGGALLLLRRRRPAPSPTPLPVAATVDAGRDLARLAEAYRQGRSPGDRLILDLDRLLRDTLAVRTGLAAHHLTSAELMRSLPATGIGNDDARRRLGSHFLPLSDRVKFAGHRPAAAEIDAALQAVAALIETAKTSPAP